MAHRSWTIAVAGASLAAFISVLGSTTTASATNKPRCDITQGKGKKLLRLVGLTTDNQLICFNERKPGREVKIGVISGLTSGDTSLVGIDFRVQDGKLWGVGSAGGLYTIDVDTAVAMPAGALTIALEGTSFGVDFNPAADRLRIVSDTGQNLRHNVNAGGVTLEDGDLTYAPPAVATGIAGAAYTNNDLVAATATTLFDLDPILDQIAIQAPPNNGNLNPTGKLNVDGSAPVGFDIYSSIDEGIPVDNRGFASFNAFGASAFYRIDLLTGASTFVGVFDFPVSDVAVPLDQ